MKTLLKALLFLFLLAPPSAEAVFRIKRTSVLTVLVDDEDFFASPSITTVTSDYSPTSGDFTILADGTSNAITINLPLCTASNRQLYNIKKIDSTVNKITVDPSGAELIDNDSTVVISSQWNNIFIQCDGVKWHRL